MKIKLMPMLAGVIAVSVAATPLIVKAQANSSTQPVPTQSNQRYQGKWDKLNLSDQQKAQLRQIHDETRTQREAVFTPQQLEQLKAARQNYQTRQAGQARQGKDSIMAALNLTDAQKAKLKEIKDAKKTRMQAVLTPEQQRQLQQMRQQWQQQRQQRQNSQQGN